MNGILYAPGVGKAFDLVRADPEAPRAADAARALHEACNAADGTRYSFDPAEDFKKPGESNLFLLYRGPDCVACATIFAPTRAEAEVVVLTSPEARRRGCFTAIWPAARQEILRRGIPSVLFVCDAASRDGLAWLAARGSSYEYSEYLMSLRGDALSRSSAGPGQEPTGSSNGAVVLRPAAAEDADALAALTAGAFGEGLEEAEESIVRSLGSESRRLYAVEEDGKIAGTLGIADEEARSYIFGVCVEAGLRGRGIGGAALRQAAALCRAARPGADVCLEVRVDNEGALGLYRKVGFEVEAEFRYYREELRLG